ncbi:MAG: YkgJ family cysteine cluster protein [Treponema sp.]|nr:YkgJ family cysteine cluster protein [Treponema sp.]
MKNTPFHAAGLRFSCTRCSGCCRHEGGFVFLSERDLSRLAEGFGVDYASFVEAWCRWVPYTPGRERLSLKEKPNLDCVFWGAAASRGSGGCTVYDNRPLQCRAFPFWDLIMGSRGAWDRAGKDCPGINSGQLRSGDEIDGFLRRLDEEPIIERDRPHAGDA